MLGGGEPGHVRAGLGDDHIGGQGADPGDGADQLPEALKRLDHHLDPGGELADGLGVPVDQVQVHPGQEGVVLAETAVQGLGQLGDLRPQPTLGQIGQPGRVPIAGDQRLDHRPPGHAQDVGGHRGQLDPGILQQLLQPLDLPAAFAGDRGPGPGQVAQLPDRLGRHERAPDQPVRAELGQPGRVRDIGLAARRVLTCRALTSITSTPGRSSSR